VRLGENPLLNLFPHRRTTVIDEIVEAVGSMAKRKVGALIAIQRDVGLGSYIEGGVLMEAEVSAELLTTVFAPNTALHDGGVVIRLGRVAAAGCLFPLTENPSISKELGMRHRAAVGSPPDELE
jgi:diadenylate cyclase